MKLYASLSLQYELQTMSSKWPENRDGPFDSSNHCLIASPSYYTGLIACSIIWGYLDSMLLCSLVLCVEGEGAG